MCGEMKTEYEKIMEEVIKEEREKARKEIALRMIDSKKFTLEEISDITGLQLDEVKAPAEKAGK